MQPSLSLCRRLTQRRLVQQAASDEALSECPQGASCNVDVKFKITPPVGQTTSSLAAAAYKSLSTSAYQVGK